MSLTEEQRVRTSGELRANLALAGRTPEEVRAELGLAPGRFADALDVRAHARPEDVWLLRDHLARLVRARGADPVPFSVLTARARLAFSLRPSRRRPPGAGGRA